MATTQYRISEQGERQQLTDTGWVTLEWNPPVELPNRRHEIDARKPRVGSRRYAEHKRSIKKRRRRR